MANRGVYFALTADQENRLLAAAGNDDAVLNIVQEEIEEAWDLQWLCEMDKAWDALHRCLAGGTLTTAGDSPAHKCVLGGQRLHRRPDYIVSYLPPTDVQQVAAFIEGIEEPWLRENYDQLDARKYDGPKSEDDFQYTWAHLNDARHLFRKAAAAKRAIIFTVGQ